MKISEKGLAFIAAHEGFVSTTYLDPVGIPTLGYGFTSRSASVRKLLGKIRPGMTISRESARQVLKDIIDRDYGPAAARGMPGAAQNEYDMGCSACFNVGARIFKWNWSKAFKAGDVSRAADIWRRTAVTAQGEWLPGLARRRNEEADLLEHGTYAGKMPRFAPSRKIVKTKPDETLKEYQGKLKKLGFDPGQIDGLRGPSTTKAVRDFQRTDPNLKVDGIFSRATMQSIDRRLNAKSSVKELGGGGVMGMFGWFTNWIGNLPPIVTYIAIGLAVVLVAYVLFKYRVFIDTKIGQLIGAR